MNGQPPFLIAATPELLKILEIAVVEGRGFAADDDPRQMVVVVNESMARTVWPGERAVGNCIRAGFDPAWDPYTGDPPANRVVVSALPETSIQVRGSAVF